MMKTLVDTAKNITAENKALIKDGYCSSETEYGGERYLKVISSFPLKVSPICRSCTIP